ncbi:DUF6984 family protein [Reichenbachiella versicolor]|uniref:DUF6984 family protein n=1 Tax=Reichenbachiella versicolor TaxID=1821036 RepID=UPI001FE8E0B5|nr:hypothetical protein [Reichenbachiella versicolor]
MLRDIRKEEKEIVLAMLGQAGFNEDQFPISERVSEYGDPFMGSINFENDRPDMYDGDIIQCEYTDDDGENVVLSLTKDKEGKLLDLDFWKSNFSALIKFPTPEIVHYKKG